MILFAECAGLTRGSGHNIVFRLICLVPVTMSDRRGTKKRLLPFHAFAMCERSVLSEETDKWRKKY